MSKRILETEQNRTKYYVMNNDMGALFLHRSFNRKILPSTIHSGIQRPAKSCWILTCLLFRS